MNIFVERADALKLLGEKAALEAEAIALSFVDRSKRLTSSRYRAKGCDPSDASRWVEWSFTPTNAVVERANWIDTQN
jgi:hypothetical protein